MEDLTLRGRSYTDWTFERNRQGLPADTPAPWPYEDQMTWFRRVRGFWPDLGPEYKFTERRPGFNQMIQNLEDRLPSSHNLTKSALPPEATGRLKSSAGYRSLTAFAALPLEGAAVGLAWVGSTRAASTAKDGAAVVSGLSPTHGSVVQSAFDAINEVMPRCSDDVIRLASKGWHTITGDLVPVRKVSSQPTVAAPISR